MLILGIETILMLDCTHARFTEPYKAKHLRQKTFVVTRKNTFRWKVLRSNYKCHHLILTILSKDTSSTKGKPVQGAPRLVTYIHTNIHT